MAGVKMSDTTIYANCDGLSASMRGHFIAIGTICTIEDKVKLRILVTDLSTFIAPDTFSKVYTMNFLVDRYYDQIVIMSYSQDS